MQTLGSLPNPAPFDIGWRDDLTRTVTVSGEIDINSEGELGAASETTGPLIIDMRRVSFIDCSGIRCLLTAEKRSASLHLMSNAKVDRLLELTHLTGHFS
jgi:anti-anti-sigma factor